MLHFSFGCLADHWQSNLEYAGISAGELIARGKRTSWVGIWSHGVFAFFRSFFLKAGFLEGTRGIIQAIMIAAGVSLKYARLWELQHQQKFPPG
jgi:hypothetical protein